MGIYVYAAAALAHLQGGPCQFQFPELVERLFDAGEHVVAFRSEAEWYEIGTFSEYERAVADFGERRTIFDA